MIIFGRFISPPPPVHHYTRIIIIILLFIRIVVCGGNIFITNGLRWRQCIVGTYVNIVIIMHCLYDRWFSELVGIRFVIRFKLRQFFI